MAESAHNEQAITAASPVNAALLAEVEMLRAEREMLRAEREMLRRALAQAVLSVVPSPASPAGLVDVAYVAEEILNVSGAFVRSHAEELGGTRVGTGSRSKWRFEADKVLPAFRELSQRSKSPSALQSVPVRADGEPKKPRRARARKTKAAPGMTAAGNPILAYTPLQ